VVDVDEIIRCEIRVERDPEQPALADRIDVQRDEGRRQERAALDDPQQAASLTAFVRTNWEQRFGLVGVG